MARPKSPIVYEVFLRTPVLISHLHHPHFPCRCRPRLPHRSHRRSNQEKQSKIMALLRMTGTSGEEKTITTMNMA